MGIWAAAAMVLGSALQAQGQLAQGEAANDAANFNAQAALRDAGSAAERTRVIGRRMASMNVTRVAKSGVELSGSPLETLAQNAADIEKQALREQQAGEIAARLYRSQGANAVAAGQIGAASSLLGGLGQGLYSFGGGVARQGLAGARGTATPVISGGQS